MKFDVLRNFLAVAETENISRASERLHLAQSALSRQILGLEEDVGADLFVRNGRRLRLSEAGKAFAEDVRVALASIEAAKGRARHVASGALGEIHVGFETISSRNRHVSEALLAFRETYPGVHMELTHLPAGPLLDAILSGAVDAGFVHLSSPSPELDAVVFQTTDWVVALPRSHRLAGGGPIRLADLAGEAFIWRARQISPAVYDRMLAACRAGGLEPNIVQEANNDLMMMNLVSVGFGLCFVVDSLYAQAPEDPVVFRKVEDFSMPLELCLAWRRDNPSKPLPHLIETVRRRLAGTGS
jgi:DNA-binding transcriptional LysR family regulator